MSATAHIALPPVLIDMKRSTGAIIAGADASIESLKLRSLTADGFQIAKAITSGEIERTIEGASTITLTVFDSQRKLLRSGIFETAVDITLDGLVFRLASVGKSGDELTLTFEERAIALLRVNDKPLKVGRDKVTRTQFVKRLVDEVKTHPIDFYAPDLPKKGAKIKTPVERTETLSKGIAKGTKLKVKESTANASQIAVMNQVLDAAVKYKASERATLCLVAAIIVECEFRNVQGDGNDAVSFGVIQAIPGTSMGIRGSFTKAQALDIEYSVRSVLSVSNTSFENSKGGGLNGVSRRHPDWSIGRVAANVINGSINNTQGAPDYVSKVDKYKGQAEAIIKAYGGAGGSAATSGKYEFSRGEAGSPEDSWTCIQRLAEEINFRAFISANTLYFLSDEDLIKSQPQMILAEFDPGVVSIDFDIDAGKQASEASLVIRAKRWRAAPGSVIEIQESGPADGRWLVQSFRRSLTETEAAIELRRASKRLPEPKGEQTSGGVDTGATNSIVQKAISRVDKIDAKKQKYLWGGGHGSFSDPNGYDCSGLVSSVLHYAGILNGSPMTTVGLNSWGKSGEGKEMTVWVNETGVASASHTFIIFNVNGKKRCAEAQGQIGLTGWHPLRSTSGFKPRHWPGT